MKTLLKCLISGFVSLLLTAMLATSFAGPTAWTQVKNNNEIIAKQKGGTLDPTAAGEVTIDFYGHAAFKMTSPAGLTMLFDPWRNDPSGAWGFGSRKNSRKPKWTPFSPPTRILIMMRPSDLMVR